MELIGHDTSTLTALFLAARPQGQLPALYSMGELIKRYNFASFPRPEQLDGTKFEFRHGAFKGIGIESFAIYNDGVIIASKSPTEFLDDFLSDVIEWMSATLGLARVESHSINRAYESALHFKSDARLLKALDALAPIQDQIAKSVKAAMGLEVTFAPFGIALAADHSLIPSMKPGTFRLERKAGLAFETNHYVSQAPLRTADHLKLLEKLEKMVS